MEIKKCYYCGEELPLSEFRKSTKNKDGLTGRCKKCMQLYEKNQRNGILNPVYKPEIIDNKKRCSYCLEFLDLSNFNKDNSKKFGYHSCCRDCHNNKYRNRYDYTHKKRTKYCKDKYNEYERKRRLVDLNYKISRSITCGIRRYIKTGGGTKSCKTKDLLGCEKSFFLEYISKMFTKHMSWSNYGTIWHLDHIIPRSSFDLTDEYQQKQCFHYSNYQPLLAVDNMIKSDKLVKPQMKLMI